MRKLIRFITSFAAVLGAYWLYALIAVPLIEPAATGQHGRQGGDSRRGAARRISSRLGELKKLVPPEARAQLETPWIIESDDFKLLMQKYTNRDDGRVMIEPCVLIYTPGSSRENAEPRPPIVLYAPAGAIMVFSRPLDLRTGDVECPSSGRLLGEITITSPGATDGPEDDLHIVTRDVQLTSERVSTTNPVQFRYGASHGSGRNLVIKLQQEGDAPTSADKAPDVKGIESFELLTLEHLHLEPTKQESAPGVTVEQGPAGLDSKRPLEITCRGPFRFDLVGQEAQFKDQVNVLQLNPQGPADQLNCELLSLHFSRSRSSLPSLDGKPKAPDPLGMENTDLQLRAVEATGNPVIVRAFSRDATARGEKLTYDAQEECVTLEGSDGVVLSEGSNEIHARSIRHKSKGKGRLGEIFSEGPGWMKGRMKDRPDQEFSLEWGDRLQLEPDEDQHRATANGGVKLQYQGGGMGTLTAERIDFWLFELPAGPGREKLEVVPDRMLVQNQVTIDSPEISGQVDQLEIWFEPVSGDLSAASDPTVPAQGTSTTTSGSPSRGEASPAAGPAGPLASRPDDKPIERRYKVSGSLAQARFLLRDNKADLAELMLEENVLLDEIPLVPTSERPMHLQGDRVQVFEAYDPDKTKIKVIGRHAEFRGRGITLSGTNINVDAAANHLGIDGEGSMTLPVDRDLKGEPLPFPEELTITWQKEMDFDGQTAQFREKVEARSRDQFLGTEYLEARFARKILFRKVESDTRPDTDLEQITCRGGVYLEGRTFERVPVLPASPAGGVVRSIGANAAYAAPPLRQESWEVFRAVDLTVNRQTGALFAQGPGEITTIRTGAGDMLAAHGMPAQPARKQPDDKDKLVFLYIKFPQSMTGNTETGQVSFQQRVNCVYEEVDSWQARVDVRDPDLLSKHGMLLTADRLSVAEGPALTAGSRTFELEASGNVTAENGTFLARAARITYNQAKEWLILEGNGYAPAEVSFQEYVGAPTQTPRAGKIFFWPETKQFRIADGRPMQIDGLLR